VPYTEEIEQAERIVSRPYGFPDKNDSTSEQNY